MVVVVDINAGDAFSISGADCVVLVLTLTRDRIVRRRCRCGGRETAASLFLSLLVTPSSVAAMSAPAGSPLVSIACPCKHLRTSYAIVGDIPVGGMRE